MKLPLLFLATLTLVLLYQAEACDGPPGAGGGADGDSGEVDIAAARQRQGPPRLTQKGLGGSGGPGGKGALRKRSQKAQDGDDQDKKRGRLGKRPQKGGATGVEN